MCTASSWRNSFAIGLIILADVLTAASASAAQVVFLDFDSKTSPDDGDYVYTSADRDAIKAGLEAIYHPAFGVTFTLTDPGGSFSTIFFNYGSGPYGGTSDHVDFLNTEKTDDAYVLAPDLLASLSVPVTTPNIVRASTNLAAHELGHILGLRHYDSFGPPEMGMPAGIAPDFTPAYPGPTSASSTTKHVMALSSTIGLSAGNLLDPDLHFGFREAIKLRMAEHPEDMEVPGDKTPMTAQPMSFSSIGVPNTMLGHPDGTLFGSPSFSAAVDVIGGTLSEGLGTEGVPIVLTDYYSFSGTAGETVVIEVMSEILDWRFSDITDPVLFLLDDGGLPVGTYFFNANEHETTDSLLFDITLDHTGTYIIEIGPAAASDPMMAGAYELFVYRFNPIPEPSGRAMMGLGAAVLFVCRRCRWRV